ITVPHGVVIWILIAAGSLEKYLALESLISWIVVGAVFIFLVCWRFALRRATEENLPPHFEIVNNYFKMI
ncbi:MAG: hypothetical protein WBK15_15355, partial [Yoonia sp.]